MVEQETLSIDKRVDQPVSGSVQVPNPPSPVKPSGFGKGSDESVAVNDPTLAAVVVGASLANGASTADAVRTGIASAGFVGATNADMGLPAALGGKATRGTRMAQGLGICLGMTRPTVLARTQT